VYEASGYGLGAHDEATHVGEATRIAELAHGATMCKQR